MLFKKWGIESLLQTASSGYLRNCIFWHSSAGFYFQFWMLLLALTTSLWPFCLINPSIDHSQAGHRCSESFFVALSIFFLWSYLSFSPFSFQMLPFFTPLQCTAAFCFVCVFVSVCVCNMLCVQCGHRVCIRADGEVTVAVSSVTQQNVYF